jgi:NCS1 family nucleobase:cation symporter-1
MRAVRWEVLAILFCVVPLLLVIFTPGVYDGFFKFLVWTSALNSALAGIGIADYFILRRQRLDLRALHSPAAHPAYAFWRGFNPIGLFSLAVGFVVYVAVFNPLSLDHAPAFLYLTASIPSCLAAGVCHLGLTWVFARRLGWGGYPERSNRAVSPVISR